MSEQATTPLPARPTIADILLSHGFVDEGKLAAALEVSDRTGQPIGQVLVEAGAITRLELASALAEQWSDPEASITLLPRPAPQPSITRSPAPGAGGRLPVGSDAVYLGQLHDAVADLARRVGDTEPLLAEIERRAATSLGPESLEELETRISALAEEVAAALGRMSDVERVIGATSDQVEGVTEGVEQAFAELQAGAGELAERLAVIAAVVETAPTSSDLAELREAVAELADRPRFDPALDGRLESLQALVSELAGRPAVPPELEQSLQDLAERPVADPGLAARLDELSDRVDSQAALHDAGLAGLRAAIDESAALPRVEDDLDSRLSDLASRVAGLAGQVESIAALSASGDDGVAIEELRGALEELGRRRAGDEETAVRVEALAAAVEDLAARPTEGPELSLRLDELSAAVAALGGGQALAELAERVEILAADSDEGDLALAEVGSRLEELATRPAVDPGLEERLAELGGAVAALQADDTAARLHGEVATIRARLESGDDSLSELRAATDELAARPAGDPELAAGLTALSERIEEVASGSAAAPESEQLGAAVTSLQAELAGAVTDISGRLQALESAPAPAPPETGWAEAAAALTARLDSLGARVDAGATGAAAGTGAGDDRPHGQPAAPEPGGETEQELERLRMAIERMSLHLGEQERAIAEVIRSRGVTQRLEELEARIEDVAAGAGGAAAGAAAADGSASPATGNVEVRALVRRLDSAEAALEAERDKLLTKLERIASSLDWRMRRLEAGDDPAA